MSRVSRVIQGTLSWMPSRMWRLRGLVLSCLVGLLALGLGGSARADLVDEAWKQGNQAFFSGDHKGALRIYETLDAQGVVSAELYYNMGVAFERLGQRGHAVWAFERALALNPADEDAQFNLAQVREKLVTGTPKSSKGLASEGAWERALTVFARSTVVGLFLVAYVLLFVVLSLRLRARPASRAPYTASAILVGCAAVLFGCLWVGQVFAHRLPVAVVLPDTVAVKEGADVNYETSFDVSAGLRVRVVESAEGWCKIRLADGTQGHVRCETLGLL